MSPFRHDLDSEPTSLCFLPCATCVVEKQQIPIYGILLDPTEALTHDRLHSEQAH